MKRPTLHSRRKETKVELRRYDQIEFDILNILLNGIGYYGGDEHAERALLLMREGVIKDNPRENWPKSGWKLTEYGKEYAEAFLSEVRARHGHVWMTHEETNPDIYNDGSEYDKSIDWFAMSYGYHYGPRCKKCGLEFCHHCNDEFNISPCPKK